MDQYLLAILESYLQNSYIRDLLEALLQYSPIVDDVQLRASIENGYFIVIPRRFFNPEGSSKLGTRLDRYTLFPRRVGQRALLFFTIYIEVISLYPSLGGLSLRGLPVRRFPLQLRVEKQLDNWYLYLLQYVQQRFQL